MRDDDEELVRKALAGETCAFAVLVERYRDMVYGLTYHYLGNFEDSRDAAQEAFVHSFLRLRDLRDPGRFAPWLRRTAMNVCADVLRRRGARLLSLEALGDLSAGAPVADTDLIERLAAQMAVQEALQHLTAKTRLTVTLFYLGGYSHAEIDRFLDIPLNTVRSRLQHAKRQLREEMQTMVNEMLNTGKPDPQFTRRVVEEALRRAQEAYDANRQEDTLRSIEEALAALRPDVPGAKDQQRLKMQALWKKGQATEVFRNAHEEAVALFEQAVSIAEELGDWKGQADKLVDLATAYSNLQQGHEAEKRLRQALALYEEMGDTGNQGRCLLMLGISHLFANGNEESQHALEQALPLLEAGGQYQGVALCHAALDLLADRDAQDCPARLYWTVGGDVLERRQDTVTFAWSVAHTVNNREEKPEEQPLRMGEDIFAQMAHLRTLLDPGIPVGQGWSGETSWSGSLKLQVAVTVRSQSERVVVPAGTFDSCLLIEQVTAEAAEQNALSEAQRQRDWQEYCGTRQAWYAPGVGLVQLHVQSSDGVEALLQLQAFSMPSAGQSQDYLPLSAGSAWTYGWANVPEGLAARDVYHVVAKQGDHVFVAHYGYVCREGSATG